MSKSQNPPAGLKFWLSKGWVQWVLAAVFFFLVSWFYMGSAISNCSTTTTALGSDSTGGFAWIQWAGGNDLTWGHTDKSNYPYGETLGKPQYITSTILIAIYKLFSSLSTPICGLNLIELLGYMSTSLTMYGLVRWLLKRNEIALFAGFAAAFVPFHQIKAQSHINYIFGSTFIAVIWAYLWLIKKPSYKKALLLSLVSAIGFYFDGYFILITAVLIGSLFASSFVFDLARSVSARNKPGVILGEALARTKYLIVSLLFLGSMLVPILGTYASSGNAIKQSLASVRSNIKSETELYGLRPIEFLLPSYNSAFASTKYTTWRATKLHGSNFSESTLYIGYTVIILALASIFYLLRRKYRVVKLQEIPYVHLVFAMVFVFLVCFALSLPALVTIFGHTIRTPVDILVKFTANWRVLSRFFLAMDPVAVILASLGLYMITRNRSRNVRLAIVALCGLVLFLEYLPAPLHYTGDLHKNAPPTYKHLQKDPSVKLVAEYPLASFVYTPEIFTFQPLHNKTLLNSDDGSISRGPFDSSIAGLNDTQTLGVLKRLKVDVIITHGFASNNPELTTYYKTEPIRNADNTINIIASEYSYKIRDSVASRDTSLVIKKGYESLSVDDQQISHRFITNKATMGVYGVDFSPLAKKYNVSFEASSICPVNAQVTVTQSGQTIWSGSVGKQPVPINLTVDSRDFYVNTVDCSVGITNMSSEAVSS
jgi:hypothetical protein